MSRRTARRQRFYAKQGQARRDYRWILAHVTILHSDTAYDLAVGDAYRDALIGGTGVVKITAGIPLIKGELLRW